MVKQCNNCKYYELRGSEEPCNTCTGDSNWKPIEHIDSIVDKSENVINFEELQRIELETYILKNMKYGDSFGISVEKYGIISALTRMSDKWNRIENLMMTNDEGTEDESLVDSLLDLSNYCKMTVMEIQNKK